MFGFKQKIINVLYATYLVNTATSLDWWHQYDVFFLIYSFKSILIPLNNFLKNIFFSNSRSEDDSRDETGFHSDLTDAFDILTSLWNLILLLFFGDVRNSQSATGKKTGLYFGPIRSIIR